MQLFLDENFAMLMLWTCVELLLNSFTAFNRQIFDIKIFFNNNKQKT